MTGLAAVQREALADALAAVPPDAPTLDDGWTAADLAAHVVVRDRRPDTMPGAVLASGPLRDWSERVRTARRDGTPYAALVELVRQGSLVARVQPLDDLVNLAEMFLHTEDVRRGEPGWEPRPLDDATVQALWRQVGPMGRLGGRAAGGPVVLEAPDGRTARLGPAGPARTVRGEVPELLVWASGRDAARVALT